MAVTWLTRPAATTASVGRSFKVSGGNDIYGDSRWFSSYDLSGYAGASANYYANTAGGTIIRTDTIPSGTPPDPVNP